MRGAAPAAFAAALVAVLAAAMAAGVLAATAPATQATRVARPHVALWFDAAEPLLHVPAPAHAAVLPTAAVDAVAARTFGDGSAEDAAAAPAANGLPLGDLMHRPAALHLVRLPGALEGGAHDDAVTPQFRAEMDGAGTLRESCSRRATL